MKQDPCFKFLAAVILVGLVLAFINPSQAKDEATARLKADAASLNP